MKSERRRFMLGMLVLDGIVLAFVGVFMYRRVLGSVSLEAVKEFWKVLSGL